MSGFRILVVEDKPEWSTALCDMFQDMFDSRPQIAASKSEAERMLSEDSHWDIVSLDLCLEGPKAPESSNVDDDLVGEELLETLEMNKCASFVICCTGIHSDRKIMARIQNDRSGKIRRTMAAVPYQLARLFPGRSLFLPKNKGLGVRDNIEDMKNIIISLRDSIDLACGKKGRIKLFVDERALLISFHGKDALVVFSKKQGVKVAEWFCYLLEHPWSEWNRSFTPDEVYHQWDAGQPISIATKRSGTIVSSILGSEGARDDEGCGGSISDGRSHTRNRAFRKRDIRELRRERDELASELGIKPRRNKKNAWRVPIEAMLDDLGNDLKEAERRHDLPEQEKIREKLERVLTLDNRQKTIMELSKDPDYKGNNESNKVQTYLSRFLTLLEDKHQEVWKLLAPEGKGGLRFVKDGGYCYDDTRCDGVKWIVE